MIPSQRLFYAHVMHQGESFTVSVNLYFGYLSTNKWQIYVNLLFKYYALNGRFCDHNEQFEDCNGLLKQWITVLYIRFIHYYKK